MNFAKNAAAAFYILVAVASFLSMLAVVGKELF